MTKYSRQVAATSAAVLSVIVVPAGSANAATARSGSYLTLNLAGGDQIVNYDHESQTAARTNVDWAVTLFFYNDAEVDRVKNILQPEFENEGSVMWGYQKDVNYLAWDNDRGMKDPQVDGNGCATDIHMRVYADSSDDQMYNLVDGYYVFATSHKDIGENCTGQTFGYSEVAEEGFATEYSNRGYQVYADAVNLGNYEPYRVSGNHIWDNNSWATKVYIP